MDYDSLHNYESILYIINTKVEKKSLNIYEFFFNPKYHCFPYSIQLRTKVPHFVYHYFIYKSSKTIGSSFFLEKFSFVKLKAVGVFFKEGGFHLLTLR